MATVLNSQLSFAAGEVSKELWSRRDLAKRQIAIKRGENVVVMVEGGLKRRSGTRFVIPLKDENRPGQLVPFRFSKADAYMLVFNAEVMRVHRNGGVIESVPGVPYEMAQPYADTDLPKLRWQGITDTIFMACTGHRVRRLVRNGHAAWNLDDYVPEKPALQPQNVTETTIQATTTTGSGTLTASAALFDPGHVGSIWRLDESAIDLIPLWKSNETVASGDKRRWQGRVYQVTGGTDTGPNPPIHEDGEVLSGQGNTSWLFLHHGYGYARIDSVASATSAGYTVIGTPLPDSTVNAPTKRWFEAAWSSAPDRGFPDRIAYIDQRLIFGRGDLVWMTRPGDLYDFEIDQAEGSALVVRLSPPDGELPDIEWISASGIIVVGASGSEWILRGPSPYDALTIGNLRPIADKQEGSAPHRPARVDGGIMFIGNTRRDLFFIEFDRLAESLAPKLVTEFSRRILRGQANELAWQRAPHRLVWVAGQDGKLVTLTFRPGQEVIGWCRQPMPGAFVENISVIPGQEAGDDELWLITRRTINGQSRRYVEQLKPFFEALDEDAPTAEGSWFVDCGLPFDSPAPVSEISDLWHLEGETVSIFADGAAQPEQRVEGGKITLPTPARSGCIGLPIPWRVRLLPPEIDGPNGSSKIDGKRANKVLLDVVESAGGHIRVNGEQPERIFPTGGHGVANQPLRLNDGPVRLSPASATAEELDIEIYGSAPLPFTLSGVSPDIDVRRG